MPRRSNPTPPPKGKRGKKQKLESPPPAATPPQPVIAQKPAAPNATPFTLAGAQEFCPVYANLAYAFLAMLPHLANPKVGPQWIDGNDWRARTKTALIESESAPAAADAKQLA